MLSTLRINQIKSTLATATLMLSYGVMGWLAGEQIQQKVAQAAPYYSYPAAKAIGLQPEQFPDSNQIEFEEKSFIWFNTNKCTNSNLYKTPSGKLFVTGDANAINKCRQATKAIGTSKHISYFKFIGGNLAIQEMVHESAWAFGTPRSQLMFAPYTPNPKPEPTYSSSVPHFDNVDDIPDAWKD